VNRIARLIDHRARALIAILVSSFPSAASGRHCRDSRPRSRGRKVELDLGPILGGDRQGAVEQGFGGRNQLDDDAWSVASASSIAGSEGSFIDSKLAEEALLRAFGASAPPTAPDR
jgi:hypothetical protein